MSKKIYTNYWVNEHTGVKKQHGSYETEEEAKRGIEAWWEIHGESYSHIDEYRTNTGAWEIKYGDDYYFYRIESREIEGELPKTDYKLMGQAEIDKIRKNKGLSDEEFLFDQLAEPYRDRLILAYNDINKVRDQVYTEEGKPIKALEK